MRTIALAAAAGLALAGCATIPAPLAGDDFSPLTPRDAVEQHATGARVRWGGEIVRVEPQADRTCFEVLSRELYPDARPKRRDQTDGRFMACSKGFYDPAVYTAGRDLTVTGTVNGTERHKVGEYDYTFAQVDANQVYLWPPRQRIDETYPGWRPYDPFWGPYYGGWGWWTPPPVVIVHERPPHH